MTVSTGGTTRPALRRTVRDRMVFGVCGGLARYFKIDPVLVRLAFVLTTLAGGAGVLAYLILTIVVPCEDEVGAGITSSPGRLALGNQPTQIVAFALVALGALLLIGNLGWLSWVRGELVWPALLIVLGAGILLTRRPAQ